MAQANGQNERINGIINPSRLVRLRNLYQNKN